MGKHFAVCTAAAGLLLLQVAGAHAEKELAAKSAPIDRFERVPPLPPEAAPKAIRTLPGFRVELVAAEPLVRSPIAIDFDEDGRLFVVEYPEYNDYAATRPHGRSFMPEGLEKQVSVDEMADLLAYLLAKK